MFVLKNTSQYVVEIMAYPSYSRLIIMPKETVTIDDTVYSIYREGLTPYVNSGSVTVDSAVKLEPVMDKKEEPVAEPEPVINAEEASAIVDKIPEMVSRKKNKMKLNS